MLAFLGWFASLATGAMPRGLRDAGAYSLGYRAQARRVPAARDRRYPNCRSARAARASSSLRRCIRCGSRATHTICAARASPSSSGCRSRSRSSSGCYLWSIAVSGSRCSCSGSCSLVRGRPDRGVPPVPRAVCALPVPRRAPSASLAANPFPGFTGGPGSYPLDLVLPAPGRQNRWKTALPAGPRDPGVVLSRRAPAACSVACGRASRGSRRSFTAPAPEGLRNLSAWALRYFGQLNAYLYLLTDAYPLLEPARGRRAGARRADRGAARARRRVSRRVAAAAARLPCSRRSGPSRPTSSGRRKVPSSLDAAARGHERALLAGRAPPRRLATTRCARSCSSRAPARDRASSWSTRGGGPASSASPRPGPVGTGMLLGDARLRRCSGSRAFPSPSLSLWWDRRYGLSHEGYWSRSTAVGSRSVSTFLFLCARSGS